MRRIRVIPILLMKGDGLVKSVKFGRYKYVGDPINAVRIFNEKEVDEIVVLQIDATASGKAPDLQRIEDIASEAFMPLAYGGGITTLEQIRQILYHGAEKVVINSALNGDLGFIREAVRLFGQQSVVASVDVKKGLLGKYQAYTHGGTKKIAKPLMEYIRGLEDAGVGELMINSIDRDGTFKGYDFALTEMVAEAVEIPVIACGGARNIDDFRTAVQGSKASAVAAGSLFVFHGKHRAVLINYPKISDLKEQLYEQV